MASDVRKRRSPKRSLASPLSSVQPPLDLLPSSRADFIRLIAMLSLAAAVALACNFIAASLNNPPKRFCDTSASEFDDPLPDSCEPCPENGICYDGKFECHHGYKKHGKLCVEDADFNEIAKKLAKWVEVVVCEPYAQLLCTGNGKCWFTEDELWNALDESQIMDKGLYMASKERAMKDIRGSLDTRKSEYSVEEFKCPELLVNHYKPLSCATRQWIIKNAILLVPFFAMFIGCLLILSKAYKRHQLSTRAEEIYHEVCDILEEKPLVSRRSGEGEPWVAASWLRDHLLPPKERRNPSLWRKVEELVQEDSRIDQYPKLVKGESKVVWEWQVEGTLGSSEKKKRSSNGSASKLKESMNPSSNVQNKIPAAWPSATACRNVL